jgi:Ser/Thr protein kinase RdoA (MazF antagonist)
LSQIDLAREALQAYDLERPRIRTVRHTWNTVFQVNTPRGRYALRINRPGVRDETDIRSELQWLAALRRDTDLVVPEAIPTRSGDLMRTFGRDPQHHAALFTWLPGARRRPTARLAFLMGQTLARLHRHAETFVPPEGFTQRRRTQVWSFGRPVAVYGGESHPLLTAELSARIRDRAHAIARATEALYASPDRPIFIHADLHFGNVKDLGDRLAVLDFDDSEWGFPIQDLGISLYYLDAMGAGHLRGEYRRGYETVRPWPEGDIELFIDARAFELLGLFFSGPEWEPYARQMFGHLEKRLSGL